MISITLLGLSAIVAPVLVQGKLLECDGTKQPNWDHCDKLLDTLGWRDAIIESIENTDDDGKCSDICKTFTMSHDEHNCALAVCFDEKQCQSVLQTDFAVVYDNIMKAHCEPLDAGVMYFTGSDQIQYTAYLNPDYTPPTTGGSKRDVVSERSVVESTLDRDTFEQRLNTSTSQQPEKRGEDDDEWYNISTSKSVARKARREQASSILSSGVTETWEFSETKTVSVGTSAEMGVGWGIFTASVGISVEESWSTTIASGMSFTSGNCPNGGVVYFVPLWTNYHGYWESDDETVIDVWIPETDGNGDAAGKFETECIG